MMTVMLIRRHLARTTATATATSSSSGAAIAAAAAAAAAATAAATTAFTSAAFYASSPSPLPPPPSHYRRYQPLPASGPAAQPRSAATARRLHLRMTYSSPTRAMRYYRVWIYTCNAVLFVCVIGFIIVACKVVVADPRRTLIPDFTLTHPSLLYAYFALLVQSGFLQLVGCLGARNLNERLLNAYWCLLLVLLIGDLLLGVYWLHHFEAIAGHAKPVLKQRFRAQYNHDLEFTRLWDMVQRDDRCCGVENYKDFFHNSSAFANWATSTLKTEATTTPTMPVTFLPTSCCSGVSPPRPPTMLRSAESRRSQIFSMATATVAAAATTMATTSPSSSLSFGGGGGNNNAIPPLPPIFSTAESISVTEIAVDDGVTIRCEFDHQAFYTTGCEKRLLNWLRSSLDILFVLGYCVISFLKLCFLGILRYEIREMIQKIRILRTEQRNNVECQDSSLTGLQKLQQIRRYDHNGSVVGVAQPLLESRNNDCGSVTSMDGDNGADDGDGEISATSPLLVPSTEKRYRSQENVATGFGGGGAVGGSRLNLCHRPQRHLCVLNTDAANDSDTNSHCALIVADEGNRWKTRAPRSSSSGGASNNYELQELQDFEKTKSSRNRNKI